MPGGHAQQPGFYDPVKGLLLKINDEVDRLPNAALVKIAPVLVDAQKELEKQLAAVLSKHHATGNPDEPWTAQHLRNALVQMQSAVAAVHDAQQYIGQQLVSSGDVAKAAAIKHLGMEVTKLSSHFEHSVVPVPLVQASQVVQRMLADRYPQSVARWGLSTSNAIRHQLSLGVVRHETFQQMTNRLLGVGNVKVYGKASPQMQAQVIAGNTFRKASFEARRLVRTEVLYAYNAVKSDVLEQLHEEEPQLMQRWDAALDSRVCQLCRDMDHVVVPIGKAFAHGIDHPPLHPHCRCAVVAWKKSWSEQGAVKMKQGTGNKAPAPTVLEKEGKAESAKTTAQLGNLGNALAQAGQAAAQQQQKQLYDAFGAIGDVGQATAQMEQLVAEKIADAGSNASWAQGYLEDLKAAKVPAHILAPLEEKYAALLAEDKEQVAGLFEAFGQVGAAASNYSKWVSDAVSLAKNPISAGEDLKWLIEQGVPSNMLEPLIEKINELNAAEKIALEEAAAKAAADAAVATAAAENAALGAKLAAEEAAAADIAYKAAAGAAESVAAGAAPTAPMTKAEKKAAYMKEYNAKKNAKKKAAALAAKEAAAGASAAEKAASSAAAAAAKVATPIVPPATPAAPAVKPGKDAAYETKPFSKLLVESKQIVKAYANGDLSLDDIEALKGKWLAQKANNAPASWSYKMAVEHLKEYGEALNHIHDVFGNVYTGIAPQKYSYGALPAKKKEQLAYAAKDKYGVSSKKEQAAKLKGGVSAPAPAPAPPAAPLPAKTPWIEKKLEEYEAGVLDLAEFKGGLAKWKAAGTSPDTVKKMEDMLAHLHAKHGAHAPQKMPKKPGAVAAGFVAPPSAASAKATPAPTAVPKGLVYKEGPLKGQPKPEPSPAQVAKYGSSVAAQYPHLDTTPTPAYSRGYKEFTNDSTASDWGHKHYDRWQSKLTSEENHAIRDYTGNAYHAMNDPLRKGHYVGEQAKDIEAHIRAVHGKGEAERVLAARRGLLKASCPEDIVVKRGMGHVDCSHVKAGDTFADNGFISTSLTSPWEGTRLEIEVPRGTPGAYAVQSKHAHEIEFILPPGTRFRVMHTRYEAGRQVIRCKIDHIPGA